MKTLSNSLQPKVEKVNTDLHANENNFAENSEYQQKYTNGHYYGDPKSYRAPQIKAIARRALTFDVIKLLRAVLPGGAVEGEEYVVANPKRQDRTAGSFKINTRHGAWADFAIDGVGGRDLASLWAYLYKCKPGSGAWYLEQDLDKFEQSGTLKSVRDESEVDTSGVNDWENKESVQWARSGWGNVYDYREPTDSVTVKNITGDIYLRARGINLTDHEPNIRFKGIVTTKDDDGTKLVAPALVLKIAPAPDTPDDQIMGVHRIFLSDDCKGKAALKSPKRALGVVKGIGIWFGDPNSSVLTVAEGPENALVGRMFYPASVSAVNAGNLPNITIPKCVRKVIILADRGKVGEENARLAAEKYTQPGREVLISYPPLREKMVDGKVKYDDWNDVLRSDGADKTRKHISDNCHTLEDHLKQAAVEDLVKKGWKDRVIEWVDIIRYMEEYRGCKYVRSVGGQPMIVRETFDPEFGGDKTEYVTPTALIGMFRSVYGVDGTDRDNIARMWMDDIRCTIHETMIYAPGSERTIAWAGHPGEYLLNMFPGYKEQPKPGCWSKMKRHIYRIICKRDKEKFRYFMKWLAWMFQNLDKHAEVVVIVKGKEGAGKDIIMQECKKILGTAGATVSNPDLFCGTFNGHLRFVSLIHLQDMYLLGDERFEGVMKQFISDGFYQCHFKNLTPFQVKNYSHIYISTNQDKAVQLSPNARRFFIMEADDKYAKFVATDAERKAYFGPILHEMDNGGRAAMLYDLLNMNLGDWHPRDGFPETKEFKEHVVMGLNYNEKSFYQLMDDGGFKGERRYIGTGIKDGKESAIHAYECRPEQLCELLGIQQAQAKQSLLIALPKIFKKLGYSEPEFKRRSNGTLWVFPELYELRERWKKAYKMDGNPDWKPDVTWSMINGGERDEVAIKSLQAKVVRAIEEIEKPKLHKAILEALKQ
jgi:hypothetical protein